MAGICVIANSVSYTAMFLQSRVASDSVQPTDNEDETKDPLAAELSHLEDFVSKLKLKIVDSVAVQFGFALISYADHGWSSTGDLDVSEPSSHLAVAMDVLSALVRIVKDNISKGLWCDIQPTLTEKLEAAFITRLLVNAHVSESDLRRLVRDMTGHLIPMFAALGLQSSCPKYASLFNPAVAHTSG